MKTRAVLERRGKVCRPRRLCIRSEGLYRTVVVCRDSLLFQVKVDMVPSTHPVKNKVDGPPNG